MMIVPLRPPTSSVILRNLPRGFSFKSKKNCFRSNWIFAFSNASCVVWPGLSNMPAFVHFGRERAILNGPRLKE